jgi:hypothetical protein
MSQIGEQGLGENARREIEEARRDPRIGRDRGAFVADFWSAFEEAERVRTFGIVGLHHLREAVEHRELKLGVSRDDENLPDGIVRRLQADWEGAEMARIEITKDHPHLNAQALVSIASALDALVEELTPSLRKMRVAFFVEQTMQEAEKNEPTAAQQMTTDMRAEFAEKATEFLLEKMPSPGQPRGAGTVRYEKLLAQEGLGAPVDRPIPADLDQALTELNVIRDILVHRAGRVDHRALKKAPSLGARYKDGDLVRINREDYRTYSAAVRCYAQEILYRPLRHWPEASDEKHGPNLADWHRYYRIGA